VSAFDDLAGLVRVRPLSERLADATYDGWGGSPFRASWSDTVEKLVAELRHLKPREVFLEADFTEGQLRQDGMPRATARPASDGVILTLVGTPHGDLRYPCSTFGTWQANVRAVALALEALRKVDRYGVTKRGEQYRGWKALPAGDDGPSAYRGGQLVDEHGSVRAALMATHPDRGGDSAAFADVQAFRDQERPA